MMLYHIDIRNNKTGETIQFTETAEDDYDADLIWSSGNFHCDCNRRLFFERAKGNELEESPCGHGGYSVRVTTDIGEVLYNEIDHATIELPNPTGE